MKSSTYYFYMKTKILADFQIYISVPLNLKQTRSTVTSYRTIFAVSAKNINFQITEMISRRQ